MAVVQPLSRNKKARRFGYLRLRRIRSLRIVPVIYRLRCVNVGLQHALKCGYTLNEHKMTPTGDKPAPPALPEKDLLFNSGPEVY
jgi:hypothetical protein